MENLIDHDVLKDLLQHEKLQEIAKYFDRAVSDSHFRAGFIKAAEKFVNPEYANMLEQKINELALEKQKYQKGGLFNV